MAYRLGANAGGTFPDLLLLDEPSGRLWCRTTHPALADARTAEALRSKMCAGRRLNGLFNRGGGNQEPRETWLAAPIQPVWMVQAAQ